jgi:hypothetical protein
MIDNHLGQITQVWNGSKFIRYRVMRNSIAPVPIIHISLSNGMCVRCSFNQIWQLNGDKSLTGTLQLRVGMELLKDQLPYWSNEPDVDFMVAPYEHALFYGAGRNREDTDRTTFLPFNKSSTFVPEKESRSVKLLWLTGLLDAEGEVIRLFDDLLWIIVKSLVREFLHQLAELLYSLGVHSSIEKRAHGVWSLHISASEWAKLISNHGELMEFKRFNAPSTPLPGKQWTVVKIQTGKPARVYQLLANEK